MSAASVLFESPATAQAIDEWRQLPRLRVDTTDPQHGWLATIGSDDPRQQLALLQSAPEDSAEVWLARARAALELGDAAAARDFAQSLLTDDPWEWRALWVDGLAAVQAQDWESAKASFNAVYQQVPGELAPKLALAFACERGGLPEVAEGLYSVCVATDAAYVPPAAFGMARVRAARGDTAGAVAARTCATAAIRHRRGHALRHRQPVPRIRRPARRATRDWPGLAIGCRLPAPAPLRRRRRAMPAAATWSGGRGPPSVAARQDGGAASRPPEHGRTR